MNRTELYIKNNDKIFLRTDNSKLFSVREIAYMISNQYHETKTLTEIYINNRELLHEDVTIPNILKILSDCEEVSFDFYTGTIDKQNICEINIH